MKTLSNIENVCKLKCCLFVEFVYLPLSPNILLFSSFNVWLGSNLQESEDESPFDKLDARLGYSFRNVVACACK